MDDGQDSKSPDLPTSKSMTKGIKRFLNPLLRILIASLVIIFLAWTIRKTLIDLEQHQSASSTIRVRWHYLLLSIAVYMVGLLPAGIAWLQALKAFGQNLPLWPALEAYFLGHLGKYVPGKAMVFVIRVGKLQPLGLAIRPGIVSVFVETLTSLCTGAVLGAALLYALDVPPWIRWSGFACIPFACLALAPHFFRLGLLVAAKSKIGRLPPAMRDAFTWRFMLRTCGWMVLGWLLNGTAAWFVLQSLSDSTNLVSLSGWMTCIAAYCLAAVAGFLSMLPGGAVVRELVITWLLAPLVTHPIALLAAVFLRITNICGECLMAGAISLIRWRNDRLQKSSRTSDP